MDSEEQKICPNCKREIPAVNFTTHTVHCARNIKVCPVCKEPVPLAELQEHHEKLHQLLPCKECGDQVCGTDLEDHVRDSCGHTIKSCRFCELELPRRDIPGHENYCGVRTEQCPDCREWVMIKYRQLHLDSNHGFLRLDDDPVPQPKPLLKTTNLPKTTNVKPTNLPQPSTSNGFLQPATRFTKNTNVLQDRPRTEIRYLGSSNTGPSTTSIENGLGSSSASVSSPAITQNVFNGASKTPKRTNNRPQINTAVAPANKVDKEPISRGAVKKRPAPKPPVRQPPNNDPKRELAYYSALQRSQQEERKRQEQNAYNLAHGLPPVLSAAAKVEKLRKMDALHNREVEDTDYKNLLQGRVWMDRSHFTEGHVLGSDNYENNTHLEAERRRNDLPARNQPANSNARQSPDLEDRRDEFKDLKPMTPLEFMNRFQELQLRKDVTENTGVREGDRFSQIKSSLRELRRGLNEVTAPYNTTNLSVANNSERQGRRSPAAQHSDEVELPCEFCGVPVLAESLVQHQTGCRPDLAQFRPGSASPRASPLPSSYPCLPPSYEEPVIPCEFCTESLPVYLISEHQERCGRESNRLFAD